MFTLNHKTSGMGAKRKVHPRKAQEGNLRFDNRSASGRHGSWVNSGVECEEFKRQYAAAGRWGGGEASRSRVHLLISSLVA